MLHTTVDTKYLRGSCLVAKHATTYHTEGYPYYPLAYNIVYRVSSSALRGRFRQPSPRFPGKLHNSAYTSTINALRETCELPWPFERKLRIQAGSDLV